MNSSVKISSDKVRENFSKAAYAYERTAIIQRQAAEKFSYFILENLPKSFKPNFILELGAGTGFVTRKILRQYPYAKFLITDISDEMLEICRRKIFSMTEKNRFQIEFNLLDFNEDFYIPNECNMIISGLSLQWAKNLPLLIDKIYAESAENAYFAFSIVLQDSLIELRKIFEDNGISYPIPNHYSLCEIRKICQKFRVFISEEYCLESKHRSLKAFLYSLKNVGAVNPGPVITNPAFLKKIIKSYEDKEFKTNYHIANIICGKRD